eukprot:gnl/TRDRNA2_/TRDRNA2_35633_c0_seq1.p1 gnl/TRDRNA2_/TRDRNA2_35633_c0~~gnl/TRDRNA2_/TRDRNA2_35633_c0_seq1.p1  ORF type:complete len:330 (-),score=73.21 gnl/TRDRNA2_/TRDRNA2_35633_c0_seq1:349-1194(-)
MGTPAVPGPTATIVHSKVAEPAPPPSQTAGIPDPVSIDKQKAQYARSLEDQLKAGQDSLAKQHKQHVDYLYAVGEQQKKQYALQIDQQIKQQEMQLIKQYNQQLLVLQQKAQDQRKALDHQAAVLTLDWSQKKAAEDLSMQEYKFKKEHFEAHLKHQSELSALEQQAHMHQEQIVQQQQAIAAQAQQIHKQSLDTHQQRAVSLAQTSAASHAMPARTTSFVPPVVHTSYPGPPTSGILRSVSGVYVPPSGSSMALPATASSYVPASTTVVTTPLPTRTIVG